MHLRPEVRSAVVAGVAGTSAATLGSALVYTLAPAVVFAPVAIAQILIRTTPGAFNSFFIGILGHWAMNLAVVGVSVAFAISGAVLGPVAARLGRRRPRSAPLLWSLCTLPLWFASIVLYPEVPQFLQRWPYALATLPLYFVAGLVARRVHQRLGRSNLTVPVTKPAPDIADAQPKATTRPRPIDPSRRYFIVSLGAGGAGVALGLANLGGLLYGRSDPGDELLQAPRLIEATIPPATPGDELFAGIDGLTPEVTSIAKHYVVDEEVIDPFIDPKRWNLAVGGVVTTSLGLSYQELKALPAIERYQTLECVSNEVGGDLISTAKWVGIPLRTILDRAGIGRGAVEVVFRASGGYSDSLPLDHAMDESTLIAIGMNDHVLPRAHGFPARLLSVGTYGFKNPKWLTAIEVVDKPYKGFWERRGWAKPGLVKTMARIDTPDHKARARGPITIAGVAYASERGISKVEVSTDEGNSWREAKVKTAISPYTWRLWAYEWTPDASGRTSILVRAYDLAGNLQTAERADPFPSGSSGYHEISVSA